MEIKKILQKATLKLKEAGIEEAQIKAKLAICHVLGKQKEFLISHQEDELSIKEERSILEAIDKLVKRVPLEHITNNREFMKLNFFVDENVLIPRQDTEILVEEVIKKCKQGRILDLCTGSGAIAVSLAKYIPDSKVYASDISEKALCIAKENAEKNGVNVTFIHSDLFENIKENDFDVIVSNPPYIESSEIGSLQEEVKKEPRIALDGGEDGLDFYRKIIKTAPTYLKHGGFLAFELDCNQAEAVCNLLNKDFKNIEVIKDLAGNDRVVVAEANAKC